MWLIAIGLTYTVVSRRSFVFSQSRCQCERKIVWAHVKSDIVYLLTEAVVRYQANLFIANDISDGGLKLQGLPLGHLLPEEPFKPTAFSLAFLPDCYPDLLKPSKIRMYSNLSDPKCHLCNWSCTLCIRAQESGGTAD